MYGISCVYMVILCAHLHLFPLFMPLNQSDTYLYDFYLLLCLFDGKKSPLLLENI